MLLRSRGPVQFCVCGDSTQESQASGREGANAESGNWKGRRFHAVPLRAPLGAACVPVGHATHQCSISAGM